jgi:hypothetical protein
MSSGQRALFENNGSVNTLARTKESGFNIELATWVHLQSPSFTQSPLRCVCTVARWPGPICDMQCVGLATWLCWVYVSPTVVAGEAVSGAKMWGVRIYHLWFNYRNIRFVTSHTCSFISYCLVYSRGTIDDIKYYSRSSKISAPITTADWQLRDIVLPFFAKVDLGQPIKI